MDAPYVDSVCLMDEEAETLTIFALNKDLSEEMELSVDVRQFEGYLVKEHIVLTHEDLKAVNTQEHPDDVVWQTGNDVKLDGGILTAVLKDKSFHVIRLGR